MTDLDPFRRIIVSDHALERAVERLGRVGCALLQADTAVGGVPQDLPGAVRAEVRIAILAGRVAETRPHWTHGDGVARGSDYGREVRYVYDRDGVRCWVVEETRLPQRPLVVKTLLLSSDVEARLAQTKHLRAGRVRR